MSNRQSPAAVGADVRRDELVWLGGPVQYERNDSSDSPPRPPRPSCRRRGMVRRAVLLLVGAALLVSSCARSVSGTPNVDGTAGAGTGTQPSAPTTPAPPILAPSEDGSYAVTPGGAVRIETIGTSGWRIDLGANTFEAASTVRAAAHDPASPPPAGTIELLAPAIDLSLDGAHNVRLGEPADLAVPIPPDITASGNVDELFFAYLTDDGWELVAPQRIDLAAGTAHLAVSHFSWFGFGKPSEDEQIAAFTKDFAQARFARQQQHTKIRDALSRQYDDLFADLGVSDGSTRRQLALDLVAYFEDAAIDSGGIAPIDTLAKMTAAAGGGDTDALRVATAEWAAKGVALALSKNPGRFSQMTGLVDGLSTAAGAASAGDFKGTLRGVATALKAIPLVSLIDSTLTAVKDQMQDTITYWTASEIERAYQIYTGAAHDRWGYGDALEGDFDTIFVTLGGGQRMWQINTVKKYCAKYGIDEKTLDSARRDEIVTNAMQALHRHFDERKAAEPQIEKMRAADAAFLAAAKAQGLLGVSNYRDFFGIDKFGSNYSIAARLETLFKLRHLVIDTVGEEMAANITPEFMARAVDQLVYWTEKNSIGGFHRYLRDMGYLPPLDGAAGTPSVPPTTRSEAPPDDDKAWMDQGPVDIGWVIRNVSGEPWAIDSSFPGWFDDLYGLELPKNRVDPGGLSSEHPAYYDEWISQGWITVVDSATYTVRVDLVAAPVNEQAVTQGRATDFTVFSATFEGTVGRWIAIEWDGTAFRQVK